MGILKLFVTLAQRLAVSPSDAVEKGLDHLSGCYQHFAYIGSRRSLRNVVLKHAKFLHQRIQGIDLDRCKIVSQGLAKLIRRLSDCQRSSDPEMIAAAWYGRKEWDKDSGVFPDFVLALDDGQPFGNGAILELKDSTGSAVSSFNSTIPTRFKSLEEVCEIANSKIVGQATWIYDFPRSLAEDYVSMERPRFYLIRTYRSSPSKVRISLVEGSFFETVPKEKLLKGVWDQILSDSGIPEEQKQQLLAVLAQLKQPIIACSRHVPSASVKPRFRIMAEVENDANLHTYNGISERTVNLVIKREPHDDMEWFQTAFAEDRVDIRVIDEGEQMMLKAGRDLCLRCSSVWHHRNGEHWCLQWNIP